MSNSLQWFNGSPPVWACLVALATVTLHAVITARRNKFHWRWIAVVLMNGALALAMLAFLWPPLSAGRGDTGMLLTAGASSADTELAAKAPLAFALPDAPVAAGDSRRIARVPHLQALRQAQPALQKLAIRGAGLSADQWRDAGPWAIEFEPPTVPDGFVMVTWPRWVTAGQTLQVSGRAHFSHAVSGTVSLLDPAGNVTQERNLTAGESGFSLHADLRATGQFQWRLRLEDASGALLTEQPVPVEVLDTPPMQMLVLLSAPSFDHRAMTHWAQQSGAQMAVRTTVSRDVERTVFFNEATAPLPELRPQGLKDFDLVIVDDRAWRSLSDENRTALLATSHQYGTGILLLVTDIHAPPPDARWWPSFNSPNSETLLVDLEFARSADAPLIHALATVTGCDEPLLTDTRAQRPVAGWRSYGAGRLGLTLVSGTHALVTSGFTQAHARYWQTLVDGVRAAQPAAGVRVSPDIVFAGENVQVCTFGFDANSTVVDTVTVSLTAHPLVPGQRCGYLQAGQPGWHRLNTGGENRHFYVHDKNNWRALQFAERIAATRLQMQRPHVPLAAVAPFTLPLPRWWFLMAVWAIATLVWVEQKLAGVTRKG